MAISLVSSTKRAGAGTSAAIDTTSATLLVAVLTDSAAGGISDSKGNTWTKLTQQAGLFGDFTAIFYVENPTVGSGHTFTTSGSTTSATIAAFSGTATSSVFDQQNGQGNGASPRSTGSVTPTEDNELIIAGAGGLYGTPGSIDGGFTLQEEINIVGGTQWGSMIAYLIQTTATSANPAITCTDAGFGANCTAVIATFKADSGGGFIDNTSNILAHLWGGGAPF